MNTSERVFAPSITECTLCGSTVEFVNNKVIYGRSFGKWPMIYLCTNNECRAFVHCHPGSTTPLGTMADSATRRLRKLAHHLFDPLWSKGKMSRSEAYAWLADQLGIPRNECHIGLFDAKQCQRVISIMEAR